ncbi:MAG: DUF4238 domain-containing protein [Chitinophagaceae bacterium]|nr:DUF4238 domain-containing protein [Chitinophagaceae bacterium]
MTSDNPVVRQNHIVSNRRMSEIFLPISPKFGIWLIPKGVFQELDDQNGQSYVFDDSENIIHYNYLQISQCTRQVFSISSDFTHVINVLKNEPELKHISRKRLD